MVDINGDRRRSQFVIVRRLVVAPPPAATRSTDCDYYSIHIDKFSRKFFCSSLCEYVVQIIRTCLEQSYMYYIFLALW